MTQKIIRTHRVHMTQDGMEPPYIVLAIHRIVEEFRSYFIKVFNMSCLIVIKLLTVDVSWLISK